MSSLAERLRWFPAPTYGVCGGADKDCAITREELDPLDQLFYDHDRIKFAQTKAEREAFDKALYEGLKALTEEDFREIPVWTWKRPFLRRKYARLYVKAAIKAFENG